MAKNSSSAAADIDKLLTQLEEQSNMLTPQTAEY